MWDNNRDQASGAGTKMHYDIECYYNNMDVKNDSTEFKWFLEFDDWVRANTNMIPYRTEMIVWDKELKLCGSIDMLYENEFGELELYDWKRCKEIKKILDLINGLSPNVSNIYLIVIFGIILCN